MLEAADKQEVNISRDKLNQFLESELPKYNLIYRLRLHDFHRGCLMDQPGFRLQGNVTLTASQGGVSIQGNSEGLKITTTGESSFDAGRSIMMSGDRVFDDESKQYVPVETVISEYLDAIPKMIKEFEKMGIKGIEAPFMVRQAHHEREGKARSGRTA